MREPITLTVPLFLACQAALGQYTLHPLSPPAGGAESIAAGIDEQGRIVGTARLPSGERVAVLWDGVDEPPTILGFLEGGSLSEAIGVASGLVIGTSDRLCGQPGAFFWTTSTGLVPFGPDLCPSTSAVDLNSTGQALLQVGSPAVPVIWPVGGGEPRFLETWGEPALAFEIDEAGAVVGASNAHPDGAGRTRAIVWRPDGSARLLGRLDDSATGPDFALAHAGGVIVGQARLGSVSRAAVWNSAGQASDAGERLGATVTSSLVAANTRGQAVGDSSLGAIMWSQDDGAILLRDLVDDSADGWTLSGAIGINDSGMIAGNGLSPTRRGRGFVLLPDGAACPADLDGDGVLTIFDFLAFQNLFDSGDPRADFDGDGALTIFDFLAFQNAFDAGCG